MKHASVEKAVSKYAKVESRKDGAGNMWYWAVTKEREISWIVSWYEDGEASCLRVRGLNDHDDYMSDYHAGSYFDTIKSAVNSFTYHLRKGV